MNIIDILIQVRKIIANEFFENIEIRSFASVIIAYDNKVCYEIGFVVVLKYVEIHKFKYSFNIENVDNALHKLKHNLDEFAIRFALFNNKVV